jgi:type IV pilus assembly protein PilM
MAFGWSKVHYSPIAIDFGADSLKLLQVVPGDPPQLVCAASAALPQEVRGEPQTRYAFYIEALRRLLKEHGFKGRRAICSIPAYQTLIQNFQLPKVDGDDLDAQVNLNLRQRLNVEPSRMVVRNFAVGATVRDGAAKQEIVCIAAGRDAVMRYIEIANRAKLDVIGMHCEPLAMLRAFSHLYRRKGDEDRTTCFIDLGAAATKLVIAHGDQMVFAKAIHAAGDHFTRAVAARESLSFEQARAERWRLAEAGPAARGKPAVEALEEAERRSGGSPPGLATLEAPTQARLPAQPIEDALECLVDELQLCLRYHQSVFVNRPIERIVFVGGEARHTKTCQVIAKALRIGAQLGDPLARLGRDPEAQKPSNVDLRQPQPGWAVPLGLCQCEANL